MLELQPITLQEAKEFVNEHHRHNIAPVGHKYSIDNADILDNLGCLGITHSEIQRSLFS